MAPRRKGAERDFPASTTYDSAMTDILNGAPLTIVPAKPTGEITPRALNTKDGPVVVFDTGLTDEDGISAALWNLLTLTGFDPNEI